MSIFTDLKTECSNRGGTLRAKTEMGQDVNPLDVAWALYASGQYYLYCDIPGQPLDKLEVTATDVDGDPNHILWGFRGTWAEFTETLYLEDPKWKKLVKPALLAGTGLLLAASAYILIKRRKKITV